VLGAVAGVQVTQSALAQDAQRRTAREVGAVYQQLRAELREAPAVHTDDTGWRVGGAPDTADERRQNILEEWYRAQLKQAVPPLVALWEPLMGVKVARFFVQRMRTNWGSCNPDAGSIRLNTDLAKKPSECFAYVVVHEMAHLLERTDNARFIALMDAFVPTWRTQRGLLNQLPVRHEGWGL